MPSDGWQPMDGLLAGLQESEETMRTLIALLLLCTPAVAQYGPPYGGPPMWNRDYRVYRPPPRPYPQVVPCIYSGECAGPPRGEPYYGLPPRRIPSPRYYD